MKNFSMFCLFIFLGILSMNLIAESKSCSDLGQALCKGNVTVDCIGKNIDKIPDNCLQDISEQAAINHPCTKQLGSGKALSKECQDFYGESEKKVEVMKEHCKALNDCQEVYQKIKNREEAQKEYQKCIEYNASKVSRDCSL